MTAPIDRLATLAGSEGLSRQQLVDALYLIRAPWSLSGIEPVIERFFGLCERFPALRVFDQCPDYGHRLEHLKAVQRCASTDATFRGETLGRDIRTQLRPFCGDSCIADLLLLQHGDRGEQRNAQFDQLIAWFVWQSIRFNFGTLKPLLYERYLAGDGSSRLTRGMGGQIYAALLAIRNLGDPGSAEALEKVIGLDLALTEERSLHLTLLLRFAALKDGDTRRRIGRYAIETHDYTMESLDRAAESVSEHLSDSVPRFLKSIWLTTLEDRMRYRRTPRRLGSSREVFKPQLRRYRTLTEVVAPIETDGGQGGIAIDYAPALPRPARVDFDDDSDSNDLALPTFSLFLADSSDPLKGYYAAKGLQASIEYRNALLPWSHSRLSGEAIAKVVSLVAPQPADDGVRQHARLTIGLSLICGRTLTEVAQAILRIGKPPLKSTHPLGVSVEEGVIYSLAAAPHLKRKPPHLGHCAPSTRQLRLPFPGSWRALARACLETKLKKKTSVVQEARALLKALPDVLAVTERGVRSALGAALLEQSRGDLGIVKVITDAHDLNFDNIIHYASYPVAVAEDCWRKAASTLVGPLPSLASSAEPARVGAPHSFDLDRVAQHFAEHRARFEVRVKDEEWISAYNTLTLYTAHWLSLATAGRKTTRPSPVLVVAGPWGLIADKHRLDGSTDRLVPLTEGLQRQIEAYVAAASYLAIGHPDLEPFERTEQGFRLRLQYLLNDGTVVPTAPKVQEGSKHWDPLPGNWARKLVRAEAGDLYGRFVDAGSGHIVRGRHPWRYTSTLSVPEFRKDWLDLQHRLETRLGFRPLSFAGLESTRRRYSPVLPLGRPKPAKASNQAEKTKAAVIEEAVLRDRLEMADRQLYEDVLGNGETPVHPPAALELVRKLLARESHLPDEERLQLAEAVCELIRRQTKVPLFAVRPRARFVRDWLLEPDALQSLAWYEAEVLPRFREELSRLPAPGSGAEQHLIEVGRLVMIAVWRLGMTRLSVLDSFLQWIAGDSPMLAIGRLRLVSLRVRFYRNGESMQRTVLVDDLSAAYLLVERQRLRSALSPLVKTPAARRTAAIQRALTRYLRSLSVPTQGLRLAGMMRAAVQRLMLEGSPILAAYASGELFTQDLDDRELRRLAGLLPQRLSKSTLAPESWRTVRELDVGSDEGEDSGEVLPLPKDLRDSRASFADRLALHRTRYVSQLEVEMGRDKPTSPLESLLKAFAWWLLAGDTSRPRQVELSMEAKRKWQNQVRIVGHALLGMAMTPGETPKLDEATLERLIESCAEHVPNRLAHGAWYQFKAFLRAPDADHAEVEIGYLGTNTEHAVSAKMLRVDEIKRISDRLASARSGIGNPDYRISASRLFDLVATCGSRRGEIEKLRPADVQGDLLRIQPYEGHTLKTAWAERVVPMDFLPEELQARILAAQQQGLERLIDPRPGTLADGSNFFDAVNQVIKQITGDQNLGLHHLRHTVAGRLLLSVLAPAVNLKAVGKDLPWVEPLLIDGHRLDRLLGQEGPSGQGLQAISAMLGHSHPTTTLTHYIHTLCVAFYALIQRLDPINITSTFENRLASPKSVERWATQARAAVAEVEDEEDRAQHLRRAMRDRLEEGVRKAMGEQFSTVLDVDERPAEIASEVANQSTTQAMPSDGETLTFDRIERMDRFLRGETAFCDDPWLSRARDGLERVATIRSGKRGARSQTGQPETRHPMEHTASGIPLPPRLPAQTATKAAVHLIDWLESLRSGQPDDYRWLIEKWMYASEKERGRMRLDTDVETQRALGLPANAAIQIDVDHAKQSKRDRDKGLTPATRMRICVRGASKFDRDIEAVRWVMTWVAALE